MAIEDFTNKAKAFAEDAVDKAKDAAEKVGDFAEEHKEKIEDALKSDKAEEISDNILGGLANAANTVTGGKFADKVEDVRSNLDDKIGNEDD